MSDIAVLFEDVNVILIAVLIALFALASLGLILLYKKSSDLNIQLVVMTQRSRSYAGVIRGLFLDQGYVEFCPRTDQVVDPKKSYFCFCSHRDGQVIIVPSSQLLHPPSELSQKEIEDGWQWRLQGLGWEKALRNEHTHRVLTGTKTRPQVTT